ncbi:unnamed protein product [Gadus morhua 'NCC']
MDEKRGWRLREEGEREGEWKKGQGRKEKEAEEETNDGGEKVIIPADIQMFVVVFLPAQYFFSHIVCPSVRMSAACVGLLLICCSGPRNYQLAPKQVVAMAWKATRFHSMIPSWADKPVPRREQLLFRPSACLDDAGSSAVFATSVMNLWVSPTASTCAFRGV